MKSSRIFALEDILSDSYADIVYLRSTIGADCYRARDRATSRDVFIKVVNSARFRRELNALWLPEQSNLVCPIDTFYKDKNSCGLIYPWFGWGSLRALIKKTKKIESSLVIDLARDLLRALKTMHDHELVHRDVKPENILLSFGANNSIGFHMADFGSSSAFSELGQCRWRGASPAYEAPESVEGVACPTSDLYSVGIVLFEAINGEVPYQGMPQEIYRMAKTRFPSLDSIRHEGLRMLILNLLQNDGEKRPENPAAALKLLDREPHQVSAHLPAGKNTLVPALSIQNVESKAGAYNWIGCDEIGEYIAFARCLDLTVFDYRHRCHGTVSWYGIRPIWHRSELWYLLGCDLYRWHIPSCRKEHICALGFIPEVIDVDDKNIAWVSHGHIMLANREELLVKPRMKKLPGYLQPTILVMAEDCILVVSGNTDNELIAYSLMLELLWRVSLDGIIIDVKVQVGGSILALLQDFRGRNHWVLAALKDGREQDKIDLPTGIVRATLTSIGAIVWTKNGIVLYRPTKEGFAMESWQPENVKPGMPRESIKNN